MTSALLVTSLPERICDAMAEKLRPCGLHVVRRVSPRFDGPLDDYRAVVMPATGTSEMERTAWRKRAHRASLPLVTLPPEQSKWPALVAQLNLPPLAAVPPPPPVKEAPPMTLEDHHSRAVYPFAEHVETPSPPVDPVAAPPPSVAPVPSPAPITFGAWLRQKRNDLGATQAEAGKLFGVSGALYGDWEAEDSAVAHDHLAAILDLYGAPPAHVGPPRAPRREWRKGRPSYVGRATYVAPSRAPLPVVAAVATPAPPSVAGPKAPMAGLRRAARALGYTGSLSITIEIEDGSAVVRVGDEQWPGASPDDAVDNARKALGAKLAELLQRAQEAQAAQAEIMGDVA